MEKLIADDQTRIYYRKWLPENKPLAVIQIVHGMAEHSGCYQELAEYFQKEGFALYSNDHRGHGKTTVNVENYGHLADDVTWQTLLEDLKLLNDLIKNRYPDIPVFIYGHSMGSALAEGFIRKWGDDIDGIILSGIPDQSNLMLIIGKMVARHEIKKHGAANRSKLLSKMSFGKFNKQFKNPQTSYDWLSRDQQKVEEYIEDPFCGGTFTSKFFYEMLSGIYDLKNSPEIRNVPHDLAFLFIAGEKDPANANGKGTWRRINYYERHGFFDIEAIFYPDSRHDLKLELNREMIFSDMVTWIKSKLEDWHKQARMNRQ